jgi:hypothetical protein
MRAVRFVAACEALAEAFEQAGRLDLATLCDKAAFWLEGGPRIDHLSLDEIVTACRESIVTQQSDRDDGFRREVVDATISNLRRIEQQLHRSSVQDTIELAARVRAVAILTDKLF